MSAAGEKPFAGAKKTVISFPAARSEGLLVETVGDETVVYDLQSKEAHCLKDLAAVVFRFADGRSSVAEIAELAEHRLGRPVSEAEVAEAIAQLQGHALLDMPLVVHNGLSRRQMIGKSAAAAGALAGASLITSVMAPGAFAQNGSLLPPGSCCGPLSTACNGNNALCEPPPGQNDGHCCQFSRDCNKCKCTSDDNDCNSGKCTQPATGCPSVKINGIDTAACGKTLGGRCCYPDPDSPTHTCCPGYVTGSGVVSCA